jgi:hypothetical protein
MIYFLITIISLLIGYMIGRYNKPEEVVKGTGDSYVKYVERLATPSIPTGVIKPKTALDEFEHNRPNKEKEGLQAFKETLDNSELKDLADKVKKQNERL